MMPNRDEISGTSPLDEEISTVLCDDQLKEMLGLSSEAWAVFVAFAITQDRSPAYVMRKILEEHAGRSFETSKAVIRFISEESSAEKKPKRKALSNLAYSTTYKNGDGKCHYCNVDLPMNGNWHVDHIIPVSKGGTNDQSNLVLSCGPCNIRKADMDYAEFVGMSDRSQVGKGR